MRVVGYLKPIPTLKKALKSVDMITKEPFLAQHERSDTCTVPAAGVIGESMVALVLARAFLEKFGGDSLEETTRNYSGYLEQLRSYRICRSLVLHDRVKSIHASSHSALRCEVWQNLQSRSPKFPMPKSNW